MPQYLFFLIVFAATFTQSLSGFGVAMVAMSLLTPSLGIQVSTPLVALIAIVLEIVLLVYYRQGVNIRAIWPIAAWSIVGVPVGVLILKRIDDRIALAILGAVIMGYALYALLTPKLPELRGRGWGYGAGFAAGMLGGAYNTAGPPVIVYGDFRRWKPAEFKGNLQSFFVFNTVAIIISHAAAGNFTADIWRLFWLSLPALGLGIAAGLALERRLNPAAFRKVVLGLLVLLGLRLIFF